MLTYKVKKKLYEEEKTIILVIVVVVAAAVIVVVQLAVVAVAVQLAVVVAVVAVENRGSPAVLVLLKAQWEQVPQQQQRFDSLYHHVDSIGLSASLSLVAAC